MPTTKARHTPCRGSGAGIANNLRWSAEAACVGARVACHVHVTAAEITSRIYSPEENKFHASINPSTLINDK